MPVVLPAAAVIEAPREVTDLIVLVGEVQDRAVRAGADRVDKIVRIVGGCGGV